MRGFTGIKDLDQELMLRMDDREFIKTCTLNKYFSEICKDDYLFKRKLEFSYPNIMTLESLQKYKEGSWKQYYANVVKIVGMLKEKWGIVYTKGNPFHQMNILRSTNAALGSVLYHAVADDEIDLVRYAINKGAKPSMSDLFMQQDYRTKQFLNF